MREWDVVSWQEGLDIIDNFYDAPGAELVEGRASNGGSAGAHAQSDVADASNDAAEARPTSPFQGPEERRLDDPKAPPSAYAQTAGLEQELGQRPQMETRPQPVGERAFQGLEGDLESTTVNEGQLNGDSAGQITVTTQHSTKPPSPVFKPAVQQVDFHSSPQTARITNGLLPSPMLDYSLPQQESSPPASLPASKQSMIHDMRSEELGAGESTAGLPQPELTIRQSPGPVVVAPQSRSTVSIVTTATFGGIQHPVSYPSIPSTNEDTAVTSPAPVPIFDTVKLSQPPSLPKSPQLRSSEGSEPRAVSDDLTANPHKRQKRTLPFSSHDDDEGNALSSEAGALLDSKATWQEAKAKSKSYNRRNSSTRATSGQSGGCNEDAVPEPKDLPQGVEPRKSSSAPVTTGSKEAKGVSKKPHQRLRRRPTPGASHRIAGSAPLSKASPNAKSKRSRASIRNSMSARELQGLQNELGVKKVTHSPRRTRKQRESDVELAPNAGKAAKIRHAKK